MCFCGSWAIGDAKGVTHGQFNRLNMPFFVICCAVLRCVQIVDMELPAGQSVLGARLVQVQGGGSRAADTALLLLTQSQIVCYQLKSPG